MNEIESDSLLQLYSELEKIDKTDLMLDFTKSYSMTLLIAQVALEKEIIHLVCY